MIDVRTLTYIAERTIPAPKNNKVLLHRRGDTSDIIAVILETAPIGFTETQEFAKHVRSDTVRETCETLWHFLKDNIQYQKDPIGEQYIQTPAYTWAQKKGDCKSYSIFTSSVLKNLGINHWFRFVSYDNGSSRFTHVYVVVPHKGSVIIMDVVMPEFNTEKKFYHKKDYKMSRIYQMSGIGQRSERKNEIRFNLGNRSVEDLTEGELDALIARDLNLTKKMIVENVRGVGSLRAERYQDNLDILNDVLGIFNDYRAGKIGSLENEIELLIEDVENGEYRMASEIVGIGTLSGRRSRRKKKKAERKASRKERRAKKRSDRKSGKGTRTGKFLRKVARGTTRLITAPLRLGAKGILEVGLPKAAPNFLYLFIPDSDVASMPKAVQVKREKQEKIANFIVNGIGMKRRHFMGIVRGGIMKRYKKSPEEVLRQMKAKSMDGISALLEGIFGVSDIGARKRRRRKPSRKARKATRKTDRKARKGKPRKQRKKMRKDQKKTRSTRAATRTTRQTFDGDMQNSFNNLVKIRDQIVQHTGAKKELLNKDNAPSLNDWREAELKKQEESKVKQIYNNLPAAGPFFLYLFIKDPGTVAKLPAVVKNKREREQYVANYLANSLGISLNEIMSQFRKGIVAKFGKNPEDVLKGHMKGKITGIGAISLGAGTALVNIIKKIAALLKKRFSKEDLADIKNNQPEESDWQELDDERLKTLTDEMDDQFDMDDEFDDGGRSFWDTLKF